MRRYRMTVLFLAFVVILSLQSISVRAKKPLDEIEREIIRIDVQEDGSMYITYEIDWKVLDSTSEGPLSWVKIGIPNQYAEEFEALSDSIKKIGYYGSGGDYARLDLNREYEAGETVNMKFSIHQHRMYEEESESYIYQFTPGWFDDISIKELKIFWAYDKGIEAPALLLDRNEGYVGTYYNLEPKERVSVTAAYPKELYQFRDDYNKTSVSVGKIILTALAAASGGLGLMIYAAVLYIRRNRGTIKDSYEKNRGLGSVYMHSGHGRSGRSHGSGCACACACACAGGGRAGCSRKDFFYERVKKGRLGTG